MLLFKNLLFLLYRSLRVYKYKNQILFTHSFMATFYIQNNILSDSQPKSDEYCNRPTCGLTKHATQKQGLLTRTDCAIENYDQT